MDAEFIAKRMKMQTVKQVLKPDWRKLFLFAIFTSIAVGGKIQAWAFSDVPPKPPLYDLLRPFPITDASRLVDFASKVHRPGCDGWPSLVVCGSQHNLFLLALLPDNYWF
jgi:hypothetical protein